MDMGGGDLENWTICVLSLSILQQIHLHISKPDGENTFTYKNKIHVRGELILFCFSILKLDFFFHLFYHPLMIKFMM